MIEVWQAGLQQVKASSCRDAADWLGENQVAAYLLTAALMCGLASKELSITEVTHDIQELLNNCQPVHHVPLEHAQQLATCMLQPAIAAATGLDSSFDADPVPLLAYMWQTWMFVAYLGHLQVAAALLPSLLQLQLQLAPDLGLDMTAAGKYYYDADDDCRMSGASAQFMWGIIVGGSCDTVQLEATLALLAQHVDNTCSAAEAAFAFLVGASQGALFDSVELSPACTAACARAVAAQGAGVSVSSRASFAADLLRAAQQWRSAEGTGTELPLALLELIVSFHKSHSSEVDLHQLLPAEIGMQPLEKLLVACQDSQAGQFAQHLLQQASEEQLQQLPTYLLIRATSTVLRFARPEDASDGSAAAVTLKALAAAAHSAADNDNSSLYAVGQAAVLLMGVSGKVPAAMLEAAAADADAPAKPGTSMNVRQPGTSDRGFAKLAGMPSGLAQIGFKSGKRSKGTEPQDVQQQQQAAGFTSNMATGGTRHQSTTAVQLPFAQLLSWLQLLGRDAEGSSAAFVASLVQDLVKQSMLFELPRKQQWQLYQLLLEPGSSRG
jgi:hypothetical protein